MICLGLVTYTDPIIRSGPLLLCFDDVNDYFVLQAVYNLIKSQSNVRESEVLSL